MSGASGSIATTDTEVTANDLWYSTCRFLMPLARMRNLHVAPRGARPPRRLAPHGAPARFRSVSPRPRPTVATC